MQQLGPDVRRCDSSSLLEFFSQLLRTCNSMNATRGETVRNCATLSTFVRLIVSDTQRTLGLTRTRHHLQSNAESPECLTSSLCGFPFSSILYLHIILCPISSTFPCASYTRVVRFRFQQRNNEMFVKHRHEASQGFCLFFFDMVISR